MFNIREEDYKVFEQQGYSRKSVNDAYADYVRQGMPDEKIRQRMGLRISAIKDNDSRRLMATDPNISSSEKVNRINAYGTVEQAQYTPENARREYAQQKQAEIAKRKEANPFLYGVNAMFNPLANANDYYLKQLAENGKATAGDIAKVGGIAALTGLGDIAGVGGLGALAKGLQAGKTAQAVNLASKARNAGNIARATKIESMIPAATKADYFKSAGQGALSFGGQVGANELGTTIGESENLSDFVKRTPDLLYNTGRAAATGAALGALSKFVQPGVAKVTKNLNPMERVKADLIKQGKEPSKELIDKYIQEHPYLYGLYQTGENTAKGLSTAAIDTAALANMDYGLNTLEGTQQQSYGEHLKNYAPFLVMGGIPAAVGLGKMGARAVGNTKAVQGAKQAIGNFIDEHPVAYNTLGTFNNAMNLKSPKNSKVQSAAELENALQLVREEKPNITTEELRAIEEYFANNPEASKQALVDLMGERKTYLNEGTITPEENNFAQANKELMREETEPTDYTEQIFGNKNNTVDEANSKFKQLEKEALEEQHKREQETNVQPEVQPTAKEQQVQEMTEQATGKKKRGRPKGSGKKTKKEVVEEVKEDYIEKENAKKEKKLKTPNDYNETKKWVEQQKASVKRNKEISQPVESDLSPVKNETDVNTPKEDLTPVKSQSDMSGETNYVPNEKAKPIVETKETKAKAKQEKTANTSTTEAPVRPKNKTVEGSVKAQQRKQYSGGAIKYPDTDNLKYKNADLSNYEVTELNPQSKSTAETVSKQTTAGEENIYEAVERPNNKGEKTSSSSYSQETIDYLNKNFIEGENGTVHHKQGRGKVSGEEILELRKKLEKEAIANEIDKEAILEKLEEKYKYNEYIEELKNIKDKRYKKKVEKALELINNRITKEYVQELEKRIEDVKKYGKKEDYIFDSSEVRNEEPLENAQYKAAEYEGEVSSFKDYEQYTTPELVTDDYDFAKLWKGYIEAKNPETYLENFLGKVEPKKRNQLVNWLEQQLQRTEDRTSPKKIGEGTEELEAAKKFSDETNKLLAKINENDPDFFKYTETKDYSLSSAEKNYLYKYLMGDIKKGKYSGEFGGLARDMMKNHAYRDLSKQDFFESVISNRFSAKMLTEGRGKDKHKTTRQERYDKLYDQIYNSKHLSFKQKNEAIADINKVVKEQYGEVQTKDYNIKKEIDDAVENLEILNKGESLEDLEKAGKYIAEKGLRYVPKAKNAVLEHWNNSFGKELDKINNMLENGKWREAEKEYNKFKNLFKTDIKVAFKEEASLQDIFEHQKEDLYNLTEKGRNGTLFKEDKIKTNVESQADIYFENEIERPILSKIEKYRNKELTKERKANAEDIIHNDVIKYITNNKSVGLRTNMGKEVGSLSNTIKLLDKSVNEKINANVKNKIRIFSKNLAKEKLIGKQLKDLLFEKDKNGNFIRDEKNNYKVKDDYANSKIFYDKTLSADVIEKDIVARVDKNGNIHIDPRNFNLETLVDTVKAIEERRANGNFEPFEIEKPSKTLNIKIKESESKRVNSLDDISAVDRQDTNKKYSAKEYINDIVEEAETDVRDFINEHLSDLEIKFDKLGENNYGSFDGKTITVNSNLHGSELRKALRHETHHAIWKRLTELLGENHPLTKIWNDRIELANKKQELLHKYPSIAEDVNKIIDPNSVSENSLKEILAKYKANKVVGKNGETYADIIEEFKKYDEEYVKHQVETDANSNKFKFNGKGLEYYGKQINKQVNSRGNEITTGNEKGIRKQRTKATLGNNGQEVVSSKGNRREPGIIRDDINTYGLKYDEKGNIIGKTKLESKKPFTSEVFEKVFGKFKKQEEAITPDKFKVKSFLSDFFPKARKQITELEQDKINLLGVPRELIENRKKQLNAEYYMPNATKHVNKQNGIDITKDQSQRKEKAGLFGKAKSGSITNSENALYDSYKELVTQMTRMKFVKEVDNILKKLGKHAEDAENLTISAGEGVKPGDTRNGYIAVNEVLLNNAMWNKFSPEYVKAINDNAYKHIPQSGEQMSYLDNLYKVTRKADYWIPEHIYNKILDGSGETIREYIERYTEGKLNGRALKKVASEGLNIANDFFKRRVLGTASFFVNNRLGNQLMIAANSKNPKEYAESVLNAFKLKPKEVPPEILENSIAEAFEGATSRRTYTGYTKVDNFINLLKGVDIDLTSLKPGAKRNWAKAANVGIALPNKLYNSLADRILNLNTKFENFERKQLFAQQVERTRRDLIKSTGRRMVTTQEAIKHINETPELRETIIRSIQDVLGDYSKFSKFERKYLKAAIPFYSWYRTITRHTIQLARKNPARFGVIAMQLKKMADDDSDLKSYQKGLGAFRLPIKDARSGKQLVSNKSRQIPWNTFGEVAEPNGKYSMVSPAIRVPIEAAKGSKFFNNSEITNDRYLRIEEYNSNKKAKPTYKYYDIRTGKYLDKLPIAPRAGYVTKEVARDLNPLIYNSTTNFEALAGGVANKFNINMPWDKKKRAEAGNFVDTDKSYDASLGGFNNGDVIGKKWSKKNGYKDITRYAGNNVTQSVKYINRFGTSLGNKTELNKAEREELKKKQEKYNKKRKKAS